MILVSYDISNDKLRTHFSKYLKRFGHRLQYSVFEIDNSVKILKNIVADIDNKFASRFQQSDSIIIFIMNDNCEIKKFGYAKNEDSTLNIVM